MSHELTHWAETKSPLLYKQLSDIVIDAMAAERGVTRDNVISTEMMKLEALYKSNNIDVKVTDSLAISELVAKACEGMLTDEKAFNSYTEKLDETQRSKFVQRVQKLFGKIADFFRDLASHYETKSKEWKELNRQADLMDKAKEKWGEMLADATKAGQADLETLNEGKLFAIRKEFYSEFDEWVKHDFWKMYNRASKDADYLDSLKNRNMGKRFWMGTTSTPYRG